jgi:hypothetical protein
MRSVPARCLVALVAAAALLVVPAGAGAALTSVDVFTSPSSGPLPPSGPDAAGAHPDFTIDMVFDEQTNPSADSVEDFDVHLAPGVVSYINHVELCTNAQFAIDDHTTASTCPAGSQIGSVITEAIIDVLGLPTPVTLTDGRIYNLEPPPGYPAAFGIDVAPPPLPGAERIKVMATVTVDPHDLAITARLHDLPNRAGLPGAPATHVNRITQTLFGYVDGNSFFTNPTSCIPAEVTVTAYSHADAISAASDAYTPVDCAGVPFETVMTASADPPISDSTSTISFNVKPGTADIPRANSHVRQTTVVAPPGVLINPALAARLDACTDAQFAQSDTSVPAACPPSSEVGDINFVSPILGAFPGRAYFGTQTATDRLRLFLNVPLYGANIKVSARVNPSYETGQITTVFDDLPQIAFTDFTLTFNGGPRSALVTPTTCGTHTASAVVTPWSGGPADMPSASFETSWDGQGAPCQRPFGPSMGTAVSNPSGGATTSFTLVANRPDRHVPIGRMTFNLPAGLIGSLALGGLTQCALSDAAAGTCPASSRLGGVQAVAGSGTEPPTLPGDVYLTKPKVPGDPAGLSVKVPARLGPVDAGVVIVGARLVLRPDGGLNAISDPIPALQLGIPLAMRQLTVTVDRPGFMRNPTSCGERRPTGLFEAIGGGSAAVSSTLRFTGCDRLGFAPRLRPVLGTRGKFRKRSHPSFTTVIRTGGGDATIRSAHVRLPKALATNLRAIAEACSPEAFAAGTCSDRARTATAVAISPAMTGPVTGPVYLVRREQGKLPKLVVALRTPVALQFEGIVKVGRGGAIATTFPLLPDLPLTKFTLRFRGGRYGALEATRNLCRGRLGMPARFDGQNGKVAKARPRIAVRGCKGSAPRRR